MLFSVKNDFYDSRKEWSRFERILVSNNTILKRTYGDEIDIELLTEFAEADGGFEEKMTLPIDFNDFDNKMKKYVEKFIC